MIGHDTPTDVLIRVPQQPGGETAQQAAINKVRASLVRTEADEVTYNLHVMLRFDLELALLEGTLKVADLPEAWRARVQSDLGVSPPDDRDGALQDVHWYGGIVGGAFQSYTLGNIMSAQFFAAARREQQRALFPKEWNDVSKEKPLFFCWSHYSGAFKVTLGTADDKGRRLMSLVPLERMGARVSSTDGRPPLTVEGSRELTAIEFEPEAASAQIKSCVLLAGLVFAVGGPTWAILLGLVAVLRAQRDADADRGDEIGPHHAQRIGDRRPQPLGDGNGDGGGIGDLVVGLVAHIEKSRFEYPFLL